MSKNKQNITAVTQFEAIEQVVILARNSELRPEFFEQAEPYLQAIANKQNLTESQALILCLMMNFCDSNRTRLGEIADFVELSAVHLLKYLCDFDVLVDHGFIQSNRNRCGVGCTYAIRQDVIHTLKQDKVLTVEKHLGITCENLFELVADAFDGNLSYELIREQIATLLYDNPQLMIAQKIKAYDLNQDDICLLMLFCHLFLDNNDDMIQIEDVGNYIDNDKVVRSWFRQLRSEQHPLQRLKLVEFNSPNPMVDGRYYNLTDNAKNELLGEMGVCIKKRTKQNRLPQDFIGHKDIAAKQMFYTCDNQPQVARLAQLVEDKNYRDVCRRMKQRGMRSGFTCLFYGAPGTGKTETVMQLARQTKREVMLVDIPRIRSKWVGESEKNIKGVFERYRHFCTKLRRKPILLFNEADAVIGIRQEGATHSVDKMENTMQNIILQEMEQFEGIMIATTNLTQNLDGAFDRRFLYKIQFDRPDAAVRANLWKVMVPELDSEECETLAKQFDFSGGQIENVARKYAINSILNDIEPSNRLTELAALCREECINDNKSSRPAVGFVA